MCIRAVCVCVCVSGSGGRGVQSCTHQRSLIVRQRPVVEAEPPFLPFGPTLGAQFLELALLQELVCQTLTNLRVSLCIVRGGTGEERLGMISVTLTGVAGHVREMGQS